MLKIARELILTDTSRDTLIVFVSTIANAILAGVFFIFVPKLLGPTNYGLFSTVTATGLMVANFANFSMDTGILKFASSPDSDKTKRILLIALKGYLIAGAAIFLLGLLLAPFIANYLEQPQITNLLRISFSGVIFLLLTNFFTAALQSQKKYIQSSLVNLSSNLARLVILALAFYFFTIDLFFVTALTSFITVVSTITGSLLLKLDFLSAQGKPQESNRFFSYNFWMAASLAISAIPFDNYFLIKLVGPTATGLYAAPFKILSLVDQMSGNFSRVLAPRFASFGQNYQAKEFVKKASFIVITVCLALLVSILFAPALVRNILGPEFVGSDVIFRILLLASVFTFATSLPVSIVVYFFGKSKSVFIMTCASIILWVLSSYLFIPKYQELGAAYAFLVSEISAFIIFTVYASAKLLKSSDGK